MRNKEIIGLITGKTPYTKKTLSSLSDLIKKYPYFQTAHLLHTLNLLQIEDSYFLIDLRKSAIFLPDRKKFFFLINDKFYMPNDSFTEDLSPEPIIVEEEQPVVCEEILSVTNEVEPAPVVEEVESSMIAPSDYISTYLSDIEENVETPPLQYQDTIDKFLEKDAVFPVRVKLNKTAKDDKIEKPEKEEKDIHDPLSETANDDSFFSETLAKIYIKQKNYKKALEIIYKLNLIYPEKSRYFADQIRFLEKLIINTNKK